MDQFIVDLVANYPWLAAVFLAIGVLRAIFKPLMSLLQAYVAATPSKADDEILAKVAGSGAYKALVWLLDYLGSIKVPVAKAAMAPAPAPVVAEQESSDAPKVS